MERVREEGKIDREGKIGRKGRGGKGERRKGRVRMGLERVISMSAMLTYIHVHVLCSCRSQLYNHARVECCEVRKELIINECSDALCKVY